MDKLPEWTARRIISVWLREHGFDGLFNTNSECACEYDDLMPCDEYWPDCTAGVKKVSDNPDYDFIAPKEDVDNLT